MAWIESHQQLARHPKTLRLARRLAVSVPAAIGHLQLLWWWAYDYAPEGDLSRFADDEIADAADGEGSASAFVSELIGNGFLSADRQIQAVVDGTLVVSWRKPGYRALVRKRPRSALRRAWEAMARRIRPLIFARDGHACVLCGSIYKLEVDHLVPLALEGTNDLSNLRTLCKPCNRRKGAS